MSAGRRHGQAYQHRSRWDYFDSLGISLEEADDEGPGPPAEGAVPLEEAAVGRASLRNEPPLNVPADIIGSEALNSRAIQFIMEERLTTKSADAYLKQRAQEQETQPFTFRKFFGFDVIADELELAGTLAQPEDCAAYAERLQIAACQRLCSGKRACTRACRIGCYVQLAGISYFYHGSTVEVMDALTTEFASTVCIRDELTLRNMKAVDRVLDADIHSPEWERFEMRPVALKSMPGAVGYVADIAAWCTFCLESRDVPTGEV